MFTLQQLKYGLEIADRGSISEAARRLFVTQPALSNSIRELESLIGITIFTRTKKGISLTGEGAEFMAQARQLVQQADLMADKYRQGRSAKPYFRVSTQHYSFATEAFIGLINRFGHEEYELTIKETRTIEVIEDVKNLVSEVGILYINAFNSRIMTKILKENDLIFRELFRAKPHVFLRNTHPLAKKKVLKIPDLTPYPYASYEQGENDSLYFSEEHVSALPSKKTSRSMTVRPF